MGSFNKLTANLSKLQNKHDKLKSTCITKEQARQYAVDGFIAGYHLAAKNTGQLLIDVPWCDLDSNYKAVIHKEAEIQAKVLVK